MNPHRTFLMRVYQLLLRECQSVSQTLLARLQLHGCAVGSRVRTSGRVLAEGRAGIRIGDHSRFAGGLVPTRLIAHPGATLRLGSHCWFNYGVRVEAYERIEIGKECRFGMAVDVCDRFGEFVARVTIEDGVWLAHGVQVRPGVRIGRGAVVSAGSVVTADVPPETLAVGNPARPLPLGLVTGSSSR
jgi:acetyltransferase-like isoleucine patch superfamily enzyme